MEPLRIGTLGAARITPAALIRPAKALPDVMVTAVAARDADRARAFAAKHGIPRVHASYDALVDDPDIDAVYNPLPNSLHAPWTLRAINAGKHVLCEKPFTSNAAEAEEVAAAAEASGLVVMEAFHYRYHPLAHRMAEVAQHELGAIRRVETWVCFPLLKRGDIRYRLDLAGGATMDAGCYAIHLARMLGGGEPEVVGARARLSSPGVDRRMEIDLRFPSGADGRVVASMFSSTLLRVGARVTGERGRLTVFNPLAPQFFHRFTLRVDGRRTRERFGREPTYLHQLRAFTAAIDGGPMPLTGPADAVANMRVIDAVYDAAGLPRRG